MTSFRRFRLPMACAAIALLSTVGTVATASASLPTAGTLYVATNGEDSGNNCTGRPCATFAYALSLAEAGDTINIGPGTWSGINVGVAFGHDLTIWGSDSGVTTLLGPTLHANRANLTLTRLTIDGQGGDPIVSYYGSNVNLIDSTVTNSNPAVCGCGPPGADVNVTDSTLSDNAVAVESDDGDVSITDSTLSANTVAIDDILGGVGVTASTISGNGAGIESSSQFSGVGASGTIISGNSGKDCAFSSGALSDGGYNIDGDGSCGLTAATSLSDVNPDLGPLANNGGSTQTMEPQSGSPAINRIPAGATVPADGSSLCPGPNGSDQRGVFRPQGPQCDVGAVEVQVLSQLPLALTSTNGVVGEPLTLTSSGGSGTGAVSYAAINGTASGCSVSGDTLSATGAGTCIVTATKAGVIPYPPISSALTAVTFTTPSAPTTPTGPTTSPTMTNPHGYWLVGSDGGIFTFGSAQFYGSTGNLRLQRPVVGITPTSNDDGYWLVASDGGIFSFGNVDFYGSIPGLGISPAGSGAPRSLNAPIVGMVPSADGKGYFMVGADGGVFAFGDGKFEGSCPGIGGCSGGAVAVMPDASGNGYWLVTATGHVYSFGDAVYHGAPGPQAVPVSAAVRTPDGGGYWILFANGAVGAYGNAATLGGPLGLVGGTNPASAIFATSDGDGYWVASANGAVFDYGDAVDDGNLVGTPLNGPVIAGTGW